jgi:YVTN family beta-propeller protein
MQPSPRRPLRSALLALVPTACALSVAAQTGFVNWETPHVHPLEFGPEGLLLAVNTPDQRLEVFEPVGDALVQRASIPVGVDPVSVRHRSKNEVWVVNHLSDSISIVDLAARNTVATLRTEDEPCDVVFSRGSAYVSCSQANSVLVFDLTDVGAAPRRIALEGEDPRALAVGRDGEVYVALFESGNGTTVLGGGLDPAAAGILAFPNNVVDDPSGPWGGVNPPPNSGSGFEPPIDPSLPNPPGVSLIVRRSAAGAWLDDNGGDWTELVSGAQAGLSDRPVGWQLLDHDVAVIDPRRDGVRYAKRLMNACMALSVNPATGEVALVGTDGTNEVRFEPNLTGTFGRVLLARVDFAGGAAVVSDLNPHLDYSVGTLPQSERDRSLGDPRAIVWSPDGRRGYVSGMGSNNVAVIDAGGARIGPGTIEVGEGPTGLALGSNGRRLYVLNKFESSISIVDTLALAEIGRADFYDPEPAAIKLGRRHLYDTHANSGLGQVACATCHIDARFDRLAWDLGDPSGSEKGLGGQNKGAGLPGLTSGFQKHHPMKGPMTTQTLQDIIGKEPLHWRGDRDGLEEFNGAFIGLQGDDANLTAQEMQEFEDFLATIHFPPNPFRELDNTLPVDLPLPGHYSAGRFAPAGTPLPNGNAQRGLALYRPPNFLDNPLACVTCHTLPIGIGTDMTANFTTFAPLPPGPNGERHHALVSVDGSKQKAIKIPQLRNLYEKVGFDLTQPKNRAGFGLLHDGSVDSIARFVEEPAFQLGGLQDVSDLVAFLLAFSGSDLPQGKVQVAKLEPPGTPSQDTHAAVGVQVTLDGAGLAPAEQAELDTLFALAAADAVGLVVKGRLGGLVRGLFFDSSTGSFQSDRAGETYDPTALALGAGPGSELTYTAVPEIAELRAGVDRDADGWFDRDELDAGSDPADPTSTPIAPAPRPAPPTGVVVLPLGAGRMHLSWTDQSGGRACFRVERAPAASGRFETLALLPPTSEAWIDGEIAPGRYDYRVAAVGGGGSRGFAQRSGVAVGTVAAGPAAVGEPSVPAARPALRAGH